MNKTLILIAFITLPMLTFGQNASSDTVKENEIVTIDSIIIPQEIEQQIAIGTFSKNDVNNLSYKKSLELISIKAFRKSLQIKVKEVKTC